MGEAPDRSCWSRPRQDVDRARVADPEQVAYISQTTLSVDETRAMINRAARALPRDLGPRTDDICYATTNRQAAVKQLRRECDLVLVIGSRNSSNSNRLVEVAREHGAASLSDRQRERGPRGVAGGKRVVGITSGASAPEKLVQRLVEFFGARGTSDVQELEVGAGGRPLHAAQGDPPGRRGRLSLGVDRCARSSSRIFTSARTAAPDVWRRDRERTALSARSGGRSPGPARRHARVARRAVRGRVRRRRIPC